MGDGSIDMEDDLQMTVSIWKMTVSMWKMTVSIWDIFSVLVIIQRLRGMEDRFIHMTILGKQQSHSCHAHSGYMTPSLQARTTQYRGVRNPSQLRSYGGGSNGDLEFLELIDGRPYKLQ